MSYSIGIDFGTLSVRAVLVNTVGGAVVAQSEYVYPHGILTRLPDGEQLPEDAAYAHPADYMEGLKQVIIDLLADCDIDTATITSIGVDATASSVLPIGENGMPLCLMPEFTNHAHAYIKLWKHHTARPYAARLQQVATELSSRFLSDCGNVISSESFFPKVLETFAEDSEVFAATYAFMEVGEWITMLLTGALSTSEPTACFKRFYHPFRGYPSADFMEQVTHGFSAVLGKLHGKVLHIGEPAGTLHERMAELFGLSADVVVAGSVIDAHAAVPAIGATSGDMTVVMGTSGVCLLCSHNDTGMNGIFSSAAYSFLPGVYGHEGGQTSVGDTLAWFVENAVSADCLAAAEAEGKDIHAYLSAKAAALAPGQSGLLMLDWNNGQRTPGMDYSLTGALLGLTNQTRSEEIYRAILESICFGARRIRDILESHGHSIRRIFMTGGIAAKNPLFCQIFADVFGKEVAVSKTANTCARGSAVLGAIAADPAKMAQTVASMALDDFETYIPDIDARGRYNRIYKEYLRFADAMSGYESVMRRMRAIKEEDR